jgi:hypothetical protein
VLAVHSACEDFSYISTGYPDLPQGIPQVIHNHPHHKTHPLTQDLDTHFHHPVQEESKSLTTKSTKDTKIHKEEQEEASLKLSCSSLWIFVSFVLFVVRLL